MWAGTAYASGGDSPFAEAPAPDLTAEPASAVVQNKNPDGEPHQVQASLIKRSTAATPGSTLELGIHLEHKPEWHTYWKSPGDIGLPTNITWTLPDGFQAGEQIYPVPVRFEKEGIVSFGYDARVLHTVPLTVPEGAAPGDYTLAADVDWLVCKTSCVPGGAHVETTLTVSADGGEPTVHEPVFAYWHDRHPATSGEGVVVTHAASHSALQPNGTLRLAFQLEAADGGSLDLHDLTALKGWPTFVPIATSIDWMIDSTSVAATPTGGAVLGVNLLGFEPETLPTNDRLGVLVQVKTDAGWQRFEADAPVPWAAAEAEITPTPSPLFDLLDQATAQADAAAAAGTADGGGHAEGKDAAEADADAPIPALANGPAQAGDPIGLAAALGLAFVGGLILNIMPCVLPVLLLKLYSLVEQGGISDAEKRTAGLAYTGGILVSFWALAMAVFAARSFLGESVGWGFQMQSPTYVAAVATAVFLFGLSMFGVFEIPAFGTGQAHELSSSEGVGGYFFTGVFATLVATPCSAPFLGTAISFGFQAPPAILFLVFTLIGAGLAAPFLVVAFVPAAYKLLPKPGAWMETFKELLGFALVATALWLVDVFGGLTGSDGLTGLLIFFLFAGMGAWVFGRFGGVAAEARTQLLALGAATLLTGFGGYTFLSLEVAEDEVCDDGAVETAGLDFSEEIPWQRFSGQRLTDLKGQTVFVDFTADWCVSCKVNEKTVLETQTVRDAMSAHGVVPLVADWTRRNQEITTWLEQYGRAGVPMYLVVPPTGPQDAILLPEVITPSMVTDALAKAAGSQG